jgi:hypothetical protein
MAPLQSVKDLRPRAISRCGPDWTRKEVRPNGGVHRAVAGPDLGTIDVNDPDESQPSSRNPGRGDHCDCTALKRYFGNCSILPSGLIPCNAIS